MPDAIQTKAWYQKPENVLTYGLLGLLGWWGVGIANSVLPKLTELADNTTAFALAVAGLAVVVFLVTSKDIHKLGWYYYKLGMKKATNVVYTIDPIGVMELNVEKLEERWKTVKNGLGKLRGQADNLARKVDSKTEKHDKSMREMAEAQAQATGPNERRMRMQMQLMARQAGRAEKSTLTYQGLLNKVRVFIQLLEKVDEACEYMIADLKDTVEEEREKRTTIQTSHSVMTAAGQILDRGRQREEFDRALEANNQDYSWRLGEIEQIAFDSESFITSMDLENGVYEADALAKLEAWSSRIDPLLEGGSGKTKYKVGSGVTATSRLLVSDSGKQVIDTTTAEPQDFADMFKKLDK
jgi:FtsZ-binding cell division protein ZapB